MREKRQISHAEKLQENVYRCSTLNKVDHKSPLLKCELCTAHPSTEYGTRKGRGKRIFYCEEKHTTATLTKGLGLTSTMTNHVDNMYP